jgi:tetratricopeptide (TPR) repeat protein
VVDSNHSRSAPAPRRHAHGDHPVRRDSGFRPGRGREGSVLLTPEEARERLRAGSPAERQATLRTLAREADARVTPAVAALLHADDPELVALAEATLWQVWGRSGDAAVDGLFAEGLRALETQDWLGAVSAFSRVVEAAPAFAEGWNKRATARYLATHYASSIADCEEVVRLNPWHFGALSGQGLCHVALGQLPAAARCFRRALQVHPRLEGARQQLARVEATLARGNGHALGATPADTRGAA